MNTDRTTQATIEKTPPSCAPSRSIDPSAPPPEFILDESARRHLLYHALSHFLSRFAPPKDN